jgi:hypothetical protein
MNMPGQRLNEEEGQPDDQGEAFGATVNTNAKRSELEGQPGARNKGGIEEGIKECEVRGKDSHREEGPESANGKFSTQSGQGQSSKDAEGVQTDGSGERHVAPDVPGDDDCWYRSESWNTP